MPEQEGQCKGKDNRTVVTRERIICRMMQEVVTNVVYKRAIVREQMSHQPGNRQTNCQRNGHFDDQLALERNLTTRSPKPEHNG